MAKLLTRYAVPNIAALVLLVATCCACSSKTSTQMQCAWPAEYSPVDAAAGQCRASRAFLSCKGSDGGGMSCTSNSLTECPEPNPMVGVTYSDCVNQCNPDEYALACGAPGPGPWPQPPATCRSLSPGPGGGTIACCPCDT